MTATCMGRLPTIMCINLNIVEYKSRITIQTKFVVFRINLNIVEYKSLYSNDYLWF